MWSPRSQGPWALGAGSSRPVQPGLLWGSSAALPALTASRETVVSSVATRPSILAKCTPPPAFAPGPYPTPSPAGTGDTGVRSGPICICAQRPDLPFRNFFDSPRMEGRSANAEPGGYLFPREKKALALNFLDKTQDPVSPPTGCVTVSSLGLSFLFRKMAITLLPYVVTMRSEREYFFFI